MRLICYCPQRATDLYFPPEKERRKEVRKSSDAQTLFVFSSQKPRKRYFLYCTFHKSFKGHPTVTLGSAIPEEKIGHFRAFLWPSAPVVDRQLTFSVFTFCQVTSVHLTFGQLTCWTCDLVDFLPLSTSDLFDI